MKRLGLSVHAAHEHEMHVVAGTPSDVVTVASTRETGVVPAACSRSAARRPTTP